VASEATLVLECVECGKKSEGSARGWRGLLTNGEFEPPGSRDVIAPTAPERISMTDQRTLDDVIAERVPTLFTFYGYISNGKRGGRGYTTRAKSLNDALEDLQRDEGDVENGYLVSDAFVVPAEGEPVIHVLLMPHTDNIVEYSVQDVIDRAR
jgi:hypothetical protein